MSFSNCCASSEDEHMEEVSLLQRQVDIVVHDVREHSNLRARVLHSLRHASFAVDVPKETLEKSIDFLIKTSLIDMGGLSANPADFEITAFNVQGEPTRNFNNQEKTLSMTVPFNASGLVGGTSSHDKKQILLEYEGAFHSVTRVTFGNLERRFQVLKAEITRQQCKLNSEDPVVAVMLQTSMDSMCDQLQGEVHVALKTAALSVTNLIKVANYLR